MTYDDINPPNGADKSEAEIDAAIQGELSKARRGALKGPHKLAALVIEYRLTEQAIQKLWMKACKEYYAAAEEKPMARFLMIQQWEGAMRQAADPATRARLLNGGDPLHDDDEGFQGFQGKKAGWRWLDPEPLPLVRAMEPAPEYPVEALGDVMAAAARVYAAIRCCPRLRSPCKGIMTLNCHTAASSRFRFSS